MVTPLGSQVATDDATVTSDAPAPSDVPAFVRTVRRSWALWRLPYVLLGIVPGVVQVVRTAASNNLGKVSLFYDDTYYYLHIARHIVDGAGSTWDGIHSTNGYQPLWMLVLLPVSAVVHGQMAMLIAVKVVQAVLWFGTMLAVAHLARRLSVERYTWIGALPFALYAGAYGRSLPFGGLETGILLFFLVVAIDRILAIVRRDEAAMAHRHRYEWVTGVILGLVVLSRLDAGMTVAFLIVWALAVMFGDRPQRILRRALRLGVPVAVIAGAYAVLNQLLFDSALPVSGRAKAVGGGGANSRPLADFFTNPGGMPIRYGIGAITLAGVVLVDVLVFLAFRRARWEARTRNLVDGALMLSIVWTSGLAMVGFFDLQSSYPLWPWYYYQSFVVLLIGPGIGLAAVAMLVAPKRAAESELPLRRLPTRLAWASVAVVTVLGLLSGVVLRERANGTENYFTEIAKAAIQLNHTLPRNAVIAMGDRSGAFGYLVGRPVVQLEGIVNSSQYINVLEHHQVPAFLRATHVNYIARSWLSSSVDPPTNTRKCMMWPEPFFAAHPSAIFVECRNNLVYTTPASLAEQFTLWRYAPPSR